MTHTTSEDTTKTHPVRCVQANVMAACRYTGAARPHANMEAAAAVSHVPNTNRDIHSAAGLYQQSFNSPCWSEAALPLL